MLIFPILVIGFMSNVIAQATASYQRISNIIDTPEQPETGTITKELKGDIELQNINVLYGQIPVLKDISFKVDAGFKDGSYWSHCGGKNTTTISADRVNKTNVRLNNF